MDSDRTTPPAADLPFLVTHWLSNFSTAEGGNDNNNDEAVDRIRQAAAQMAEAFSDLGMFGTANQPIFNPRDTTARSNTNATYHHVRRQWSNVPTNQLELVAQSAASIDAAAVPANNHNLFQMATELIHQRQPNSTAGHRLGDTIDLTGGDSSAANTEVVVPVAASLLQPLPLLSSSLDDQEQSSSLTTSRMVKYVGPNSTKESPAATLELKFASDRRTMASRVGQAMRAYLKIRDVYHQEEVEIATLERSLRHQQTIQTNLEETKSRDVDEDETALAKLARIDEWNHQYSNTERVICQLQLKMTQLKQQHAEHKQQVTDFEQKAKSMYQTSRRMTRFRDPTFVANTGPTKMLHSLVARQCGIRTPKAHVVTTRQTVLTNRMSHAHTVNTHLSWPVYCLSFDKTGRYFCTGADDSLVKLFCLGPSTGPPGSCNRNNTFSCGFNGRRQAVLVSTLRGHAGVICDIDVSSDNAFLATASDDGDVRVWGLKDGCPIAILRGHRGGANMVSWSLLTPYRLVTTGMDGLARIWDIREAALKRYGSQLCDRDDYTLELTDSERRLLEHEENNDSEEAMELPPLPEREGAAEQEVVDPAANVALPPAGAVDPAQNLAPPPVQQAPVIVAAANQGENAVPQNLDNNAEPGAFVADDSIDEGVKIIARLQHGEVDQDQDGPGTRSRGKTVKVICVARSPLGGQFATGSDDGLCRLWEDEVDQRVVVIDGRETKGAIASLRMSRNDDCDSGNEPSTSKLLTTLVGHIGAITDLHYSNAGDRILTASQKDGNARIWSFGANYNSGADSMRVALSNSKQIILRLSKIDGNATAPTGRRRRGDSGGTSGTSVTCDVAIWTADDSKIVTSQSCPVKKDSQDIVPGTQLILVWDSWTGNCLIAIKGAHTKQCPVIVPHPLESNIICSAAADGIAKVWDLKSGKCTFVHKNVISWGPVASNNEEGAVSGYLDGTFDPHGLHLVLADDNGRLTIVDCLGSPQQKAECPAWKREQYFANDYYELYYNVNGYCLERGSEQPPHLAPRGARCNHAGAPFSEDVSDTFRSITGPAPLSQSLAIAARNLLRSTHGPSPPPSSSQRRGIVMTDFDPHRTVQICGSSAVPCEENSSPVDVAVSNPEPPAAARAATNGRALSSNYRWRDYDDVILEEERNRDAGEVDADDEEFELPQVGRTIQDDADDDDEDSYDEADYESSGRSSRARGGSRNSRSARARNRDTNRQRDLEQEEVVRERQRTRRSVLLQDSSDEDEGFVAEMLSGSNTPFGPFVNDYEGHFFRMPNHQMANRVKREWLQRMESFSSFNGNKVYSPQAGDSVVYIPKAYSQLIREYPTLKTPWRRWPSGAQWPLVRCQVLNVRYRFPFKDYFRVRGAESSTCQSVVAILTLEVNGVPEPSPRNRHYPWPQPSFVSLSDDETHIFEVPLFQNFYAEYILPERIFLWRIEMLELALQNRTPTADRPLDIVAFYAPDSNDEDVTNETDLCKITSYVDTMEEDSGHLSKSGFECLMVTWSNNDTNCLSPWEVIIPIRQFATPPPPTLSEAEKGHVATVLQEVGSRIEFTIFSQPVDTVRFSDYLMRIEIPLDFSFMKKRLQQGYYNSFQSVLSDVKIIRENCLKYNGPPEGDDISQTAVDLFDSFRNELKNVLSKSAFPEEFIADLTRDTDIVLDNAPPTPLDSRTRTAGRSSLELLPPPDQLVAAQGGGRSSRSSVQRRFNDDTPLLGRITASSSNLDDGQDRSRRSSRISTRTSTRGGPSPVDNTRRSLSRSFSGRSTRASRPSYTDPDEEDDDEEEEVQPVARSSRRAATRTSHARVAINSTETDDEEGGDDTIESEEDVTVDEEEEEDDDSHVSEDDDEDDAQSVSRRASPRRAAGRATAPLRESNRRHSPRARKKAQYKDDGSDIDLEVDAPPSRRSRSSRTRAAVEADDESDETDEVSPLSRSNGRAHASPVRASSSRQSRRSTTTVKYTDGDSDDDDDEEEEPSSRRRKRSSSGTVARAPKRVRASLPVLQPWPSVSSRRIGGIALGVIELVKGWDALALFYCPVVESNPDLKRAYSKAIDTPMDIRTIEEDRMHHYKHIKELQNDLILMYRNCVTFNGAGSEFGLYAIDLWRRVNEAFQEVCRDQSVRIPSAFSVEAT